MDKYMKLKDVPKGKRWEHYWYYYKWQTIIGLFVLVMAITLVKDVFFQEKMDVSIPIATTTTLSYETTDRVTWLFKQYAEDYSGNNKVSLDIHAINYPSNIEATDPNMLMASQVKLIGEIQSKETLIFILDDDTNAVMDADEIWVDLDTVIEGGVADLGLEDNRKLPLHKIPAIQNDPVLSHFPENMFLVLRSNEHANPKGKEALTQNYLNNISFLNNLIHDNVINEAGPEPETNPPLF